MEAIENPPQRICVHLTEALADSVLDFLGWRACQHHFEISAVCRSMETSLLVIKNAQLRTKCVLSKSLQCSSGHGWSWGSSEGDYIFFSNSGLHNSFLEQSRNLKVCTSSNICVQIWPIPTHATSLLRIARKTLRQISLDEDSSTFCLILLRRDNLCSCSHQKSMTTSEVGRSPQG